MENKVIKYQTAAGAEIELSLSIVREMLTDGKSQFTDTEIAQFIELCRYNGLNPFLKEAYLLKYEGKNGNPPRCSMVVSKETFLKRAESNPDYDGSKSGIVVVRDGEVTKVVGTLMLQGDTLVGGWAEVHRKSQKIPTEISVSLAEYHRGNTMWNSKPATMIRKVALVQALRESFANQLGACYDEAELPIDVQATVVESTTPPQATVVESTTPPQATKAVAPKKSGKPTFESGQKKVLAYIKNNNLDGAIKGIEWLKTNYPNRDIKELVDKAQVLATNLANGISN